MLFFEKASIVDFLYRGHRYSGIAVLDVVLCSELRPLALDEVELL